MRIKDGFPLWTCGRLLGADKCGIKIPLLPSGSGKGDTVSGAQSWCPAAPGRQPLSPHCSLCPLPERGNKGLSSTSCSQKHLSTRQVRLVKGKDKRQAATKTSVCLLVCYKAKQPLRDDRAYWNKFQHLQSITWPRQKTTAWFKNNVYSSWRGRFLCPFRSFLPELSHGFPAISVKTNTIP